MGQVTVREIELNRISMRGLMILLGIGSPISMRTVNPVKLRRAGRDPFGLLLKRQQLNLLPQRLQQQLLAGIPAEDS